MNEKIFRVKSLLEDEESSMGRVVVAAAVLESLPLETGVSIVVNAFRHEENIAERRYENQLNVKIASILLKKLRPISFA